MLLLTTLFAKYFILHHCNLTETEFGFDVAYNKLHSILHTKFHHYTYIRTCI